MRGCKSLLVSSSSEFSLVLVSLDEFSSEVDSSLELVSLLLDNVLLSSRLSWLSTSPSIFISAAELSEPSSNPLSSPVPSSTTPSSVESSGLVLLSVKFSVESVELSTSIGFEKFELIPDQV